RSAARHGDPALFDQLAAAAKAEKDEAVQGALLSALGAFRDPALAKRAQELALKSDFESQQLFPLIFGPTAWPGTRDAAYEFVKQNWDALIARLPTDAGASLPFVAAAYCDADHLADAEAFFKDRATKYSGGPRNFSQAMEQIRICVAGRAA